MACLHADSPDYAGAAQQTAVGNHNNINTPWGSMNWNQEGNGQWQGSVSLSPDQQKALDAQQGIQAGRSGMAQGLLGQAGADLSKGINWQGMGQVGNGSQARDQAISGAYGQATSRLDPQWNQRQEAQQAQLLNQGLDPGSQAYDTSMGNFGRERNDAYTSALNGAIQQGTAAQQATFGENLNARQQQIGEAYQQQYGGMNALNAFLGGQQVGMPSFPGANMQGANMLQAAGMQGQQNNAEFAQTMGVLSGGLGGAGQVASAALPFALA